MAAATDPTMELIASLDDPAKWIVTTIVAFVPHERDFPAKTLADGTVIPATKITVTEADLRAEAEKANRRIRTSGQLDPITIGHRNFEPGFPETQQPPLVGFARDYGVQWIEREQGRFLGLVYEEHAARDKAEQYDLYRQFPFRSVDYHPTVGLAGVAALIRPPALNMGTTYLYEANVMAEPKKDDDDTKMYAAFCRYMKKYEEEKTKLKEPEKYQAPVVPPPVVPPPVADPTITAQYAADLADLRKKLVDETAARVAAECRSMLDPLRPLIKFTYEKELDALTRCADSAARAAHVKYMAENYMPLPGGEMIKIYQGDASPARSDDPHKDYTNREQVQAYIRSHPGVAYEAAVAACK